MVRSLLFLALFLIEGNLVGQNGQDWSRSTWGSSPSSSTSSQGQYSLRQIDDIHFTVNSRTKFGGRTRVTRTLFFPENTIGFYYVVDVEAVGNGGHRPVKKLLGVLQLLPDPVVASGAATFNALVPSFTNRNIDVFFMENNQKSYFESKTTFYHYDNFALYNVSYNHGFVPFMNKSRAITIGFRNNDLSQGVDVQFQVVALIKNH